MAAQHAAERARLEQGAAYLPAAWRYVPLLAALEAAEQAGVPLHCYWCDGREAGPPPAQAGKGLPKWASLVWGDARRRFCQRCRGVDLKGKLSGVRPAAARCPTGCAGCAGWEPAQPAAA